MAKKQRAEPVEDQLRAFEDREARLLGKPPALAERHGASRDPGLKKVADLGGSHVEAPAAVGKLAHLNLEHREQAATSRCASPAIKPNVAW